MQHAAAAVRPQSRAAATRRAAGQLRVPGAACLRTAVRHGALVPRAAAAQPNWLAYDSDDYEWDDEFEGLAADAVAASAIAAGGVATGRAGNSVTTNAAVSSSTVSERNSRRTQQSSRHSRSRQHQQHATPSEGAAGEGIVGLFVAGWMALIGLLLRVLQPVVSLVLMLAQPLTHMSPARARYRMEKMAAELPEGFWAKLHWIWEQPVVKSIRITASVANWGVRLPAIAALLLTQGSMLASQVSLPMLAPLLLGTGMMVNSIKKNASFLIPRLGLLVVLLWVLWFVNSVIQTTWLVLRNQGRIDARTMSGARMITECSSLLLAGIVVLSTLGININALLLPTGVVLAIASKDLLQNLIAGLYLVLVQPFRLGDKVAVSCTLPSQQQSDGSSSSRLGSSMGLTGPPGGAASSSSSAALGAMQGWFEGVCEKVDLRYTVIRDGRRRLMVPNTAFVSREFIVYDDGLPDAIRHGSPTSSRSSSPWPTSGSSSNSIEQQAASPPIIREGHMTTELPPMAQPIFPGMTIMTPPGMPQPHSYPQYAPQHYTALHYQPYQQLHGDDKQQQQHEQGLHHGQSASGEPGFASLDGGSSSSSSSSSSSQQQQQQLSGSPGSPTPTAKGPPGYLPQGYTAGYYGIPVYWPGLVPGVNMMGPWSSSSGSSSSQTGSSMGSQQQHYEPSAMHQPVAPPFSQQQLDQEAECWRQQQQQQQAAQRGSAAAPQAGQHSASDRPQSSNQKQQQQQQRRQSGIIPGYPSTVGRNSSSGGGSSSSNTMQQPSNPAGTAGGSQGSNGSSHNSSTTAQYPCDALRSDLQQHAVYVGAVGGYGFWTSDVSGQLHPAYPTYQPHHTPAVPQQQDASAPHAHQGGHAPAASVHNRGHQEGSHTRMNADGAVPGASSSSTGGEVAGAARAAVSEQLPAGGFDAAVVPGMMGGLPAAGMASAAAVAGTAATHLQQQQDLLGDCAADQMRRLSSAAVYWQELGLGAD